MAVVLRLRRLGANKRPYYRLVACDSRKAREGAFLEKLGVYDPRKEKEGFTFDKEKVIGWLKKGATPSGNVQVLLKKSGLFAGAKPEQKKVKGEKKAAAAK